MSVRAKNGEPYAKKIRHLCLRADVIESGVRSSALRRARGLVSSSRTFAPMGRPCESLPARNFVSLTDYPSVWKGAACPRAAEQHLTASRIVFPWSHRVKTGPNGDEAAPRPRLTTVRGRPSSVVQLAERGNADDRLQLQRPGSVTTLTYPGARALTTVLQPAPGCRSPRAGSVAGSLVTV